MTSSVIGLRRSSKALPKAKLPPKKVMVIVGLLLIWSTTAFWIPAKPLHLKSINEMLRKLQHLQPELVNRKGPVLHDSTRPHITQAMIQKLNEMGPEVLPHLPYLPELVPTTYHFFKQINNFLQGKCFHNQQELENTFQEFIESRSMGFYTTGIKKLMSRWQKCVDFNGFYFDW